MAIMGQAGCVFRDNAALMLPYLSPFDGARGSNIELLANPLFPFHGWLATVDPREDSGAVQCRQEVCTAT